MELIGREDAPRVHLTKDGGRTQPGLPIYVRKVKHWEAFRSIDPDALRAAEEPPSDVQAALEDVMGPDRMRDLKLRLHPIFRRWTLFERQRDPTSGMTNSWGAVSVFQEEPRSGHLPSDLQGRNLGHLRGQMGDYRMPHRKDFEIIEKTDLRKYGYRKVENYLAEPEKAAEREADRIFEDRVEDFHDYHFLMAMAEAQEHYSKPWSTRTITPHTNASRWKIEQRDGYQVRTRVWDEEGDLNAMKELGKEILADKREVDDPDWEEVKQRWIDRKRGRVRVTFKLDGTRVEEAIDEKPAPKKTMEVESAEDLERKFLERRKLRAAQRASI